MVKPAKVYISDTGLLHMLQGIRKPSDLTVHPTVGASWESYVISQVIAMLPKGIDPYFFRTSDGTECDLVLVENLKPLACVEIKLGNVVKISKGLLSTVESLKTDLNFILTFDSDDYYVKDNIRVLAALDFIKQIPDILNK